MYPQQVIFKHSLFQNISLKTSVWEIGNRAILNKIKVEVSLLSNSDMFHTAAVNQKTGKYFTRLAFELIRKP